MVVEDLSPAFPRIARLVRKAGWSVDDVRQEAWLCLQSVLASPGYQAIISHADRIRYATKALSRWCFRKARGGTFNPLLGPALEDPTDPTALIELNDLIDSAPAGVRDYLGLRVIERLSWDETRAVLRMSNDSLARLRHRAADWLLAQYEGESRE